MDTLCKAPVVVAQSMCPSLLPEAERIEKVYSEAFKLLGECHRSFNANQMDEAEISALGM